MEKYIIIPKNKDLIEIKARSKEEAFKKFTSDLQKLFIAVTEEEYKEKLKGM